MYSHFHWFAAYLAWGLYKQGRGQSVVAAYRLFIAIIYRHSCVLVYSDSWGSGLSLLIVIRQEWLWCESWCSDESKAHAKTIDLCNNPRYKENKLDMARRVVSGALFNESWVELDEEVRAIEKQWRHVRVADTEA